jgi:hypothetical protein
LGAAQDRDPDLLRLKLLPNRQPHHIAIPVFACRETGMTALGEATAKPSGSEPQKTQKATEGAASTFCVPLCLLWFSSLPRFNFDGFAAPPTDRRSGNTHPFRGSRQG